MDKARFYKNLKILFLWSVGLQNLKKTQSVFKINIIKKLDFNQTITS
ncbi:hypothetical protein HPHPH6_1310 [Helicobacter pylori Hp H-6]|uniref:Uncharacterized protein n=1 Tax=Helicobacter pylori Hp H-6 TaxID=992061 RepID=I9UL36_HELPX|nr:hypothetical protein HPHPH6_1310 [Helicobacter pylori Hp H-6]